MRGLICLVPLILVVIAVWLLIIDRWVAMPVALGIVTASSLVGGLLGWAYGTYVVPADQGCASFICIDAVIITVPLGVLAGMLLVIIIGLGRLLWRRIV